MGHPDCQQQQQQTQHKVHRAPMQANQPSAKMMMAPGIQHTGSNESCQVQRKLFSFFYIYAILIVTLYVTYAAYYFYQHHQSRQQQTIKGQQQDQRQAAGANSYEPQQLPAASQLEQHEPLPSASVASSSAEAAKLDAWKQELEAKFKFVEKYVEILSIELQETQRKLSEREKCDCSLSCTFNGTRYADRSSWQNQCDTCTCQSGRISCQARKCPPISCDDPIQLPGQCCPVCMKRCKYNGTLIRHGQKFSPPETNKECKCQDGHIKCELAQRRLGGAIRAAAAAAASLASETTEQAKGSDQRQQQQQQPKQVVLEEAAAVTATNKVIPASKDNKASQMSAAAAASSQTISGLKHRVEGEKSGLQHVELSIGTATSVGGAGDEPQLDSTIGPSPDQKRKNIENG